MKRYKIILVLAVLGVIISGVIISIILKTGGVEAGEGLEEEDRLMARLFESHEKILQASINRPA